VWWAVTAPDKRKSVGLLPQSTHKIQKHAVSVSLNISTGKNWCLSRGLDQRIDAYKAENVNNARAHDIVIRAVDCAAITPAQIPDVLLEWRKPSHEEFAARNAFSLWNAFTEVYKTVNPHTAVRRGEALHGLFDAETGVALAS